MSYYFGFNLVNKEKKIKISLFSVCGRNSETIYNRLTELADKPLDGDRTYWLMNIDNLKTWGKTLNRITEVFHGISHRKIDECSYSDEVYDAYADLCYDLGVRCDGCIIFTLIRLNDFIKFLVSGDLFEYETKESDGYYLEMWESY